MNKLKTRICSNCCCVRSTDKLNARKALERKEQYKQVTTIVIMIIIIVITYNNNTSCRCGPT